jgi:hypothetical protein
MEYVSQEEFDRVAKAFDERRAKIEKLNENLKATKTLAAKTEVYRQLKTARKPLASCSVCGEEGHTWQRCGANL